MFRWDQVVLWGFGSIWHRFDAGWRSDVLNTGANASGASPPQFWTFSGFEKHFGINCVCVRRFEKMCWRIMIQQETHIINLPLEFKSGWPSSSGKGQPEGSPHDKRFSCSPKLPRLFFAGQAISQLLTRRNLEKGLVPTQRELGYVDLCWLLRRLSPTPWDLPGHSPPPMQGKVGKFNNL